MRNDPRAKTSDADFIRMFEKEGPAALRKKLGLPLSNIHRRRNTLERLYGRQIRSPDKTRRATRLAEDHSAVLRYPIKDGVVLIGSDAHIWPGEPTTAMRAFVKFCKEYEPQIVILNGDVLDFPQVSRHPPIGHLELPNIADEIEAAQDQLHDIEMAVRRQCRLVWTLGNHDARFETRLATVAPEYARLHGHSLKDHFPAWSACWRCDLNDSVTVKHRHKGGIHATHNSTMWAGRSMVTGHLHSQKVAPFSDYNGTRYGVDTGCLADPEAKAFVDYTEANPLNWRSGFAVLTFKDGQILPPELVTVWDDKSVTFRGEIIKV
jgi:hypothetical protein